VPVDESFTGFFEALPEGAYIGQLDAAGSTTLAANAHLRLIFGWPAKYSPQGRTAVRIPNAFWTIRPATSFSRNSRKDGQVEAHLLRLRRANGSAFWVDVTARATPNKAAHGLRVEAVIRDVSERKKLQDQTRDMYQQLVQAEKLASLGPDDVRSRARAE
jgi:PAS domain-containing protein